MDKKEFVKNLKKVKVVIGNGFDLHCGLKSSYGDYFEYYKEKYNYIKEWIDRYAGSLMAKRFFAPNLMDCWVKFERFDEVNVWDVFFEIITEDYGLIENARWCDIENEMLKSIVIRHIDKISVENQRIGWNDVFTFINGENDRELEDKAFNFLALCAFVLKKRGGKTFEDELDYYEFLLNELRKFEINFGNYLKRQHDYFDGFINHHNSDYDSKAIETLSAFADCNQIVSIDSFNFGKFNDEKYDNILRNINGTLNMPIFGIDSETFNSDDSRIIFSKTNRRMEMDMIVKHISEEQDFDNAVIYGHSLSKNDYSYFFPLLDKLDMTSFVSTKKIIFAFSIYDDAKSYQIKSAVRKAVRELFYAYAIFKGYKENPSRLLDALTTQGRIVMYEIPCFNIMSDYFWN